MKPNANEQGFTIVEVLIAVLILTVGVLGLASTSALVTRMIGQSYRFNTASELASQQFEMLRATPCDSMAASGSATYGNYTLSFRTADIGNRGKRLQVVVTTPTGVNTTRADTFSTAHFCRLQ